MANTWFRLHHDMLDDPVVQALTAADFKVYINTLCYASKKGKDGQIGTIDDVSFALRVTKEALHDRFIALHDAGLIVPSVTDSETFHIPQWKKKQYKSDSSTERVRKYRARSNASDTATVTPPDTDTDTDTEEIKRIDHSENDHLFDLFWESGMKKIGKKKAQPLFNKILKADKCAPALFTLMLSKDIHKRLASGQLGFAEMHPTTYLNGERWKDEIVTSTQASNVTTIRERTDLMIAQMDEEDARASH